MPTFDVVVIGGGPGGYVAAIRASQLGLNTALVEKEALGGVCLNWGCIPTKALLRNAEVVHLLSQGKTFGFKFENLSVDYGAAHKRSRRIVARQTKGVRFLMKKNNITLFEGTARLKNAGQIIVEPEGQTVTARHIIIATGAAPRLIPGVEAGGRTVITYRHALNLTAVPKSALIVGAGPIGMEFATLWKRYGTDVTVLEMLPHALPLEDEDISLEAEKQFRRAGIAVKTGARVQTITPTGNGVAVTVQAGQTEETLPAETVLVAIGFAPNSQNLGLEEAGVATERGAITIDDRMQTSAPTIYAIGDVTGKLGLAHVASAQGIIAAEAIAGRETPVLNYANIPRCTYAHPEVASVGLTEAQAREQGYDVITARFPFQPNGKALAMDDNTGFVKLVAEAQYKQILGVHLIGGHVTELIAGPTGMITLETTAEELARTVHPHPTLSEVVMEAAHALAGQAIHL
ncbi:MAG: dihydrolipoyl dehydrogenase [Anaerolineae bacterium]